MPPRWSCACAPARAVDRDGAEYCRPFDPIPHAPDWPAPPRSDHSPRTDSPRPCEQSIAQLLCRSVAGPGFAVSASHRTCGRRAFGTMPRWCPVGRQSPPRRVPCDPVDGQSRQASLAERAKPGEIGRRLGRKALCEVATAALPDTILAWYRRLVTRKFDGSQKRRTPGRPRINREVEELIVRMAEENRSWGYDRIVGALANLGHEVSDQTVGNILRRHGLPPAPERKHTTTWAAFIRAHLAVLAGTDFFTVEVLTLRGLVTYYVLFFIHLESRKVDIAGITVHPDQPWMQQMARNVTMEGCGTLRDCRYLLHDRDTKYTISFRAIIESGGVKPLALPARSPNLNAYAERWVRSVTVSYTHLTLPTILRV